MEISRLFKTHGGKIIVISTIILGSLILVQVAGTQSLQIFNYKYIIKAMRTILKT